MAVAHSAASESHTGITGSTNQTAFSWTHTQTGTPQGVVVFVSTYASVADLITSVTYGGIELTRLANGSATDTNGELGRMDAFFLDSGLGSDNQTITVNRTNNATVMYASAATVTAGANTAVPTATIVLIQNDGTLAAQSVDDTSPGQNSLRYAAAYSGLSSPPAAATGSTLLNSIDLGSYGSALVRETTAGQGARSVGFSAANDDRAVVHLAIRELVPRDLSQTVGTFSLIGNAATLLTSKQLIAETSTFALTGNEATLQHQYQVAAEAESFALTGNDVTLAEGGGLNSYDMPADVGSFALTGGEPSLTRTYALPSETGTVLLTGNSATLVDTDALQAESGSFAVTGGAPAMRRTYYLSGGAGAFIETGQSVGLADTDQLQVDTGHYLLTCGSVAIARAYTLASTAGAFVVTGNPVVLTEAGDFALSANRGQFNMTGNAATLEKTSTARRRNVLIF